MELEKVIQEKVDLLVSNGSVEKMIEGHISKCIDGALNDLLRDYSDFGKQVKAAIGTKLQLSLDKLNIDCYTTMVCKSIEDIMNLSVLEQSKERIQRHTREVLALIEKKHWKLSEIVKEYRDSLVSDNTKVDLEYKEESYGNYIYLGEKGKGYGSSKAHEITIHLNKKENNKIFAISNRGQHITPLNIESPGRWEIFLMKLWANECTVEIDMDEAESVAERYDEEC